MKLSRFLRALTRSAPIEDHPASPQIEAAASAAAALARQLLVAGSAPDEVPVPRFLHWTCGADGLHVRTATAELMIPAEMASEFVEKYLRRMVHPGLYYGISPEGNC